MKNGRGALIKNSIIMLIYEFKLLNSASYDSIYPSMNDFSIIEANPIV
jgi:hypothetical protein